MSLYEWITTALVPLTGIVSWLAGTRSRQNKVIREMQETIYSLVEENKRVYGELCEARREIAALHAEIAELKKR